MLKKRMAKIVITWRGCFFERVYNNVRVRLSCRVE